jgi:Zn-dependent protease
MGLLFPLLALLLFLNIVQGQLPYILGKLLTDPIIGIVIIIALVIGITIHEASHAFIAYRLGDPTAKLTGRLSLNPLSHLDPIGSIAIILIGIGWGKPTPFDPFNLRNIKRDSALISVAGAVSNFTLAIILSLPYLIANFTQNLNPVINTIYYYLSPIIFFNILLGIFNLVPVAPLDGFKVLAGLLPRDWYQDFMQMERYGIFILLLLFATGAFAFVVRITSIIFSLLISGLAVPF